MGWVANATPRSFYPRERDPVPILQGGEWVPGSVRNGYGKSHPHWGVKTPDRPARNESLPTTLPRPPPDNEVPVNITY
jgi:hypothetical protein